MPRMITRITTAAATVALGVGALTSSPVASAADSTIRPAVQIVSQYTRATLNLTGTWRLTSVFTSRLGQPIRPGSVTGNDVYITLARQNGEVAPPGNEPVYIGSVYDATTHHIVAGELQVSPYVSPRGIVLTMWQAGNPEGFADAYEAVYAVQGRNSTLHPLSFTGTWIDQDHNAGTTGMTPAPGAIVLRG